MEKFESLSRRETLVKGALALGAVAALPTLSLAQNEAAPAAAPAPTPLAASDLEIVRFALTLERLEAAFYAQVLGAHGTRAYLSGRHLTLAQEIGAAENAHVAALEAVLRNAGAEVPAAQEFSFPNNVFVSPVAFSWFAYTLEEIGVRAYLGAVGKIRSQAVKEAAASIYGAEARHVALLRLNSGNMTAPHYFESPLSAEQVQSLIAPYLK